MFDNHQPAHGCIKTTDELTLLTGLNSIQSHGNAHFVVIVNPGNGPGPDVVPDDNYLREIPQLTAYPNVDVVGYVHTTFAQRDLSAVTHDINTYSNWAQQGQHPGLGISGIFVDETPNQYDARAEKFLSHLTKFAKSCHGFAGDKLVCSPYFVTLCDSTNTHTPRRCIFPQTHVQTSRGGAALTPMAT